MIDLIRQVIALRQSGDVQGSLDLIDRSFAEGISSNYLLDNRARALSQLNREEEAIQIWEALSKCGDLELQEKSKRLVYQCKCRSVLQHVVQLFQLGHASEVLSVLDVARAEGIENDMLLDNRARALSQLHREEEAVQIWESLFESSDLKLKEKSKRLVYQYKCRSVLQHVVQLSQLGHASEALSVLDVARAEGIENDMLLDNRARALSQLNREEEAVQIWESLFESSDLKLKEKSKRLVYQYKCRSVLQHVVQLSQLGHASEALSVLDVARAEGVENDMLLDNRARALSQLNREEEAIQIWESLFESSDLKLKEKSKRLVYQYKCRSVLQHVVQLSQLGHASEALSVLDVARAEGIENDMLLDNRARALSQLNREEEAIQIWESLFESSDLKLKEKSKRLVYQCKCRSVLQHVVQLSQLGHASEVLSVLDVARAEGIENDMLLDNRARVLVQLNRPVEAISIWRQLSQSDPKKYNAILISQLVGALQLICRSQGWHVQHFDKNVETLDKLEEGVLQECELLRGRGYTKLLIKLVDQALESGFESPLLALAKANALIELEQFVDAKNFLNYSKESVRDQNVLVIMEDMLDTLSRNVEAELVVRALVPLKAKGDLDAAQNLLLQALLQNHSCVLYEEKLQELLVERGEKNSEHQAFELFLGEAERIRDAASLSSQ